ncbi:MAG: dipeptide epimerase [Spirochaetaceae bacterium]|nr:dipeptide epimerase [Spirochaetaceae bacterium]
MEIFPVSMTMKNPYSVAYDRFEKAENLFVRIGVGPLNGWGCAAPDFHVTGEKIEDLLQQGQNIFPDLIKKDPFRRALIMKRLKKEFPGSYSLWAAVDMALWDLVGKKADLPLWKLLGGYRERIRTSVTIGICDVRETMSQAKDLIAQGIGILKIKGGTDVHQDIERIKNLRETFPSSIRIRFDANQGYTVEEAFVFLRECKTLDIELFEQPTSKSRPEHLGVVTRKSETPIMADESLISLLDAFHLVKKGLIDLMNIKLMKVGGITEAIQVDAVARSAGVEVMVGCMDESALGIAAGLHFALSRKNIRFADLDGHLGLKDDPADGSVILKNGYLYPASGPGFGWRGL